jgi:IS605 OrfB family transposase
MKLVAQVKLETTKGQHDQLKQTLERINQAGNYISEWAWEHRTFGKYKIQQGLYREIRDRYGLSAQMTVRAIAKVAEAYQRDRRSKRTFGTHGAVAYDSRILSYKQEKGEVSVLTLEGRLKMPYVAGEKQREMLKSQEGESDLVYRKGTFYLYATCNIEAADQYQPEGVLGVDLGIANIATTSEGEVLSGARVNGVRARRRRQRQRLQQKGTQSAKRVLKRLSGRERRFARDVNHRVAKQLVNKAKDTGQAIALENLQGIRDRARLRKPQRVKLHSWAFHQLSRFIRYKAQVAGVRVDEVDPRYTSQTCSVCGCTDKRNRPSQERFSCVSCGHAAHADINAATNIAHRGWPAVNQAHGSAPLLAG